MSNSLYVIGQQQFTRFDFNVLHAPTPTPNPQPHPQIPTPHAYVPVVAIGNTLALIQITTITWHNVDSDNVMLRGVA